MPLGLECPLSRVTSPERPGILLCPLLSFPTRGLDVSPAIGQSVERLFQYVGFGTFTRYITGEITNIQNKYFVLWSCRFACLDKDGHSPVSLDLLLNCQPFVVKIKTIISHLIFLCQFQTVYLKSVGV